MSGRKFPKNFVVERIEAGLELKTKLLKRLIADAKAGKNGLREHEAATLEAILAAVRAFYSKEENED